MLRAALLVLFALGPVFAQTGPVVARAASIAGRPQLSNTSLSVPLTPGYILNPGDRVDTRGGGRVVIDLSDGSMVVVQPESVIVLKDYRQAESLRELFEIVLGAVRVKINHFAGRPNPYRMNTPTASIAVRGTEFSIEVDAAGNTKVEVFEGAVEVSSLTDPDRKALVEAGRGVLVQGGQDFHLIGANFPRGGDMADGNRHTAPVGGPPMAHPDSAHPAAYPHNDPDDSPRAVASGYDRYIAGLTDAAQVPFLYRFNAFAEPHLDSLENPAYATGFHTGEGRIFVLPTFSGVRGLEEYQAAFGPGGTLPGNYSLSPQISLFTPVGGGYTIGGAVSASRVGNTALAGAPDFTGTSSATFYTGSLVAAREFGRTSAGVEFEKLRGSGGLTTVSTDDYAIDRTTSTSSIAQTRLTAGVSHDFGSAKVGAFYRYGFIAADDVAQSHTVNGLPAGLFATGTSGHSTELGVRLRGSLSRRLTYGVAAMWTGVSLGSNGGMMPPYRAQRTSLAGGVGWAVTQRTTLSFDVTGGAAGGRFASVHAAVQTTVTRHLFATASYLNLWQCPGMQMYPVTYPIGSHFSDFGAGWRFTRDLFAQYLYSTDYGFSAPSHTLMLRYTFRLKGE